MALRVEGLGKSYRLWAKQERKSTLAEAVAYSASRPIRAARRIAGKGPKAGRDEIVWALREVSFEVRRGQVLGIIGRNGAGKSTLLKILSRITEPSEGYADIYGRVGSLLEVGTGFHPELSGRENIYLNGAILGMPRRQLERKFDDIIAFAEVERFVDTPVKHYSSGMYLRLAFAVAAHLEPEILLVDEVLAVGDVSFQKKCTAKMGEVARDGRTVLFVSHNMGAIADLCDTGLLLRGGSVAYLGNVAEAVKGYLDSNSAGTDDDPESSAAVDVFQVLLAGEPSEDVSYNSPMALEARCRVKSEVPFMRLNLILFDALQNRVLHLQTDTRELGIGVVAPGLYRIRIDLPTLWLASGVYTAVVKLRVIGSDGFDGKIESSYLPIVVAGNSARMDNLLSPDAQWQWDRESGP
jgi:lipopolysaccharide transport system ATP-binding protein